MDVLNDAVWNYRGTSLIRNSAPLGPYSIGIYGGRRGVSVSYMSEVPL